MPFDVNIDLSELEEIEDSFGGFEKEYDKHIRDMLNAIGYQIQSDGIEMIIKGPKRTGKKYTRNGREATRSAWGEPAKNDTGILQSSLQVLLEGSMAVKIGYLQSIAPYGEDLEDPSKLNRPVLTTVQAQNVTFIRAQIKRTVKNIINL